MYRSILVHVQSAAGARLSAAIDIAKRFDGTLIGLAAGLPQLPISVSSAALGVVAVGAEYSEVDRQALEAEFAKAGALFKEKTAAAGVKGEWRAALEGPAAAIVAAAAAADLLVVGPGNESLLGDFDAPSAGDIVLHTGRPVLLVPKGVDRIAVGNVVVAWKNTPEAQRALADGVPFMKDANVVIVQVKEGEESPSAADAQAFLARHGIAATVETLTGREPAHEQITAFAKRTQADLIVAGAYGHTRLREWIFGGVTRGLIADPPAPCLLSH